MEKFQTILNFHQEKKYELFLPVFLKIQELLEKENPVIVAIDGRCGSGKTRLAELLAQTFACNCFHMDDYYLPVSQRKEDWKETAGENMDFDRFLAEVLKPLRTGEQVWYAPYDCQKDCISRRELIAPKQLSIVEGSYSQHPVLSEKYDLKIFLTCAKEVQEQRLKEREGGYYEMFEKRWIPLEEQYIQKYDILEKADVCVDTTTI